MTPDNVIQAVCEVTGVSLNALRSRRCGGGISNSRFLAALILREKLNLTNERISTYLGGKNRSSVTYQVRRGEAMMAIPAFASSHASVLSACSLEEAA